MDRLLYQAHIIASRMQTALAHEKKLHAERFARPHELVGLSAEKPDDYGIILGVDQFGRFLQITATKTRKQLGNVLKIGPSQCGKSTDFKEQLRHWKGSVIANDIKGGELSRDTADIRAQFSDVYFFNPTGRGDRFDPLLGKTNEHEL